MIFITLNKKNKIKIKWVLSIITLILVLLIPFANTTISGGNDGNIYIEYKYLWNIVSLLN